MTRLVDGRERNLLVDTIMTLVIVFALFCFTLPLIVILSASFSSELSIMREGYSLFPREFSLDAYRMVFGASNSMVWSGYRTTIIVTVVGASLSTFITILAAYPLSRKMFKFRSFLSLFVFLTMLLNGGIVPWYMVVTQWYGLRNNYMALIIPYLANVWNVFLLRNFMSSVPDALEESAMIDGAGNFRTLFSIFIPLCGPGIATITLFNVLMYWNDWWLGLMLLEGNKIVPLQLFLVRIMQNLDFLAQSTRAANLASWGTIPAETVRMAICILAIGPIVFAYPFFQRHIVKGMLVGSVKG